MNTIDPFKDHKVKNLFLLIGENPLPNYVAAMKLLDKGGTAYLVHTNQTKSQKDRLTQALKDKGFKIKPVPLDKDDTENNKSNAYKIYEIVKLYAQQIPVYESLGLNYTGGTNTMAVHAHRAISFLPRKTVYSYLDASTLEIFIDTSESEPFHRGVQLEVSLQDLFKLHKYEFKFPPISEPIFTELAVEFVKLYQNEDKIASSWRNFCKKELIKTKDSEGWWINEEITLSLAGVNQEIIKVLQTPKYNHCFNINGNQVKLKKSKTIDNLSQIYAWLSGCWLEHYVLSQIQDIAKAQEEKYKKLQIGESQMSFIMKKSQTSEGGVFEFDVAFMRNYQLFAISCTTSKDPKECKLKLFEAYIRAKQLGGDEARVALVCCCDDDSTKRQQIDRYLKSQLEGAVTNPKIAVFIRKDLPNIKMKIADWIIKNKGKNE
jgi:hypothetical protein